MQRIDKECPCRFCKPPKRNVGCHGKCEEYLSWQITYQEEKDRSQRERDIRRAVSETMSNRCKNMKTRRGVPIVHKAYVRTED